MLPKNRSTNVYLVWRQKPPHWCGHAHLTLVNAEVCLRNDYFARYRKHLPHGEGRASDAVVVRMQAAHLDNEGSMKAQARKCLIAIAGIPHIEAARKKHQDDAAARQADPVAHARRADEFFEVEKLARDGAAVNFVRLAIGWPPAPPAK